MKRKKEKEIWVRVSLELKEWCVKQAELESRSLSGWVAYQLEKLKQSKS